MFYACKLSERVNVHVFCLLRLSLPISAPRNLLINLGALNTIILMSPNPFRQ